MFSGISNCRYLSCTALSTVSDTVEGLIKAQCTHDKIVVGLKQVGDGVREMNKSYSCGCSRLKGKLVQETEILRRTETERR